MSVAESWQLTYDGGLSPLPGEPMPATTPASKQSSPSIRRSTTPTLERDLNKAAKVVKSEIEKRNKLIRELHRRGHTLRQIGDLAGLSHTQIGNIVEVKKPVKTSAKG